MSTEKENLVLNVTIAEGKYTFQQNNKGNFYCLRYSNKWRNLTGDGMVYSLVAEVETLRDRIKYLERKLDGS